MASPPPTEDSANTIPANQGGLSGLNSFFRKHADLVAAALVAVGLLWRLWLARATFLNTDEAWHFWLGNRDSAWLAYDASLTINHPPLLVLILHFLRLLGTSNLFFAAPFCLGGDGLLLVLVSMALRARRPCCGLGWTHSGDLSSADDFPVG